MQINGRGRRKWIKMKQMKSLARCQALVNYRDKWRDYHFNGPRAVMHILGNVAPIIWSIILVLAGVSASHRDNALTIKYNQLLWAHNAPLIYHNFWERWCVNGQWKYQFPGQPPPPPRNEEASLLIRCHNIFQRTQRRRTKWSRRQTAVERSSITSTRLWRNLRTSRCDVF